MASDSATMRLLQCLVNDQLAVFLNASAAATVDHNESVGVDRHRTPAAAWNGSGGDDRSWNDDPGSDTSRLRDAIKSKLVPTICLVGIVGNLLTLVALAFQRLRAGATAERKVNVWLQALAASDLMLCVALLPHGLMTYGHRLVYASLSFQLLYQAISFQLTITITVNIKLELKMFYQTSRRKFPSPCTSVIHTYINTNLYSAKVVERI